MNKQDEYTYPGRGIHDPKFLASLTNGKLSKMLTAIREANEKEKEGEKKLDVQIRNNYLNIYYRGSNAVRVMSENSIEFDKFYFYIGANGYDTETLPKTWVERNKKSTDIRLKEEADDIISELKKQVLPLKAEFKKQGYNEYFIRAKKAIDNWLDSGNDKGEREAQHKMVACQTLVGYTIIDIEFAVSTESKYKCDHAIKKVPRFDIIAVNDAGELCVIELKKGVKALEGTSGLKDHWDCFNGSVGNKKQNADFIKEMTDLLEQKKALKLIEADRTIKNNTDVRFLFAYEYKGPAEKDQEARFAEEFKKIPKQDQSKITTLWLKNGVICRQTP